MFTREMSANVPTILRQKKSRKIVLMQNDDPVDHQTKKAAILKTEPAVELNHQNETQDSALDKNLAESKQQLLMTVIKNTDNQPSSLPLLCNSFFKQKQLATEEAGIREIKTEIVKALETKEALKKKPEKRIQETLSQKVEKLLLLISENKKSYSDILAEANDMNVSCGIRSQEILLQRINGHLKNTNKKEVSLKGHCHGIVLLWLIMMSWKVEIHFYEIIKMIVDCLLKDLLQIDNIIVQFLECIDLGQRPGIYSDESCSQKDIEAIMGNVSLPFSTRENFTMQDMENKILENMKAEGDMIVLQGWWPHKITKTEEGHSLGIIMRDGQYCLFDPNREEGEPIKTRDLSLVVEAIWKMILKIPTNGQATVGVQPAIEFSFYAVIGKEKPRPECSSMKLFQPQKSDLGAELGYLDTSTNVAKEKTALKVKN